VGLRSLPHLALIRHVLLIVNPTSRRGGRYRTAARDAVEATGIRCTEVLTERSGHASELARAGAGSADAVFVLGGDGTLMEVAGALAHSGIPVGALPGGTGNLMASALGVPRDVAQAVRLLLRGTPRRFDLGCLSGTRYFVFAAGLGLDAQMVRRTSVRQKRHLGMSGYVFATIRTALRLESFELEADVDGVIVRERAVLALVANAGSILGGLFQLGPDVRPDDGQLDLCVFLPRTVGDLFAITWRVWRRDFRPDRRMRFVRGRTIRLASVPVQPVEADGELVGETPVVVTVEPGAATFLVGERG
jgi:YegS/Rv2252/BmrU family lipid kinase